MYRVKLSTRFPKAIVLLLPSAIEDVHRKLHDIKTWSILSIEIISLAHHAISVLPKLHSGWWSLNVTCHDLVTVKPTTQYILYLLPEHSRGIKTPVLLRLLSYFSCVIDYEKQIRMVRMNALLIIYAFCCALEGYSEEGNTTVHVISPSWV